jgi:hypothetical protein
MKKHTTLYVLGGALLLVGGYLYLSKNSNKSNVAPPMEEGSFNTSTTTTSGETLSGASQVINSIKDLIKEIKTKAEKKAEDIQVPTIPKRVL